MIHNGTYTLIFADRSHRTFRVSTWKGKNKRILSVMFGPDNVNDYAGLGFVENDGSLSVWSRMRGHATIPDALLLLETLRGGATGCRVEESRTCRVCNRKLTTPESIASGIGPECGDRVEAVSPKSSLEVKLERKKRQLQLLLDYPKGGCYA